MKTRDEAVKMMASRARESLALKRGGPDDRFLDGVATGICVALNCLGAVDELRALETLLEGERPATVREEEKIAEF